jgi:hypothetical protein
MVAIVNWAAVAGETLHVAWLPSATTTGTWKVWATLPGMYAEYIGEKTRAFEHPH